jgi:hypothetical protein
MPGPNGCGIRIDEEPCPGSAVYRIVFGDCEPCRILSGWLFCLGHPESVGCTAKLRTRDYMFIPGELDGGDVSPVRVCDLDVA